MFRSFCPFVSCAAIFAASPAGNTAATGGKGNAPNLPLFGPNPSETKMSSFCHDFRQFRTSPALKVSRRPFRARQIRCSFAKPSPSFEAVSSSTSPSPVSVSASNAGSFSSFLATSAFASASVSVSLMPTTVEPNAS